MYDDHRVIRLQLSRAEDLFEMPQTDMFSEYRSFLTGVDYCLSELRSHPTRSPVRLELELPASDIDTETRERLKRTLRRYCEHRMSYNQRERRAIRLDGVSSLKVGLPVALLGMVIALVGSSLIGPNGNATILLDTGGWVLTWVGLWFPLDTLLFTPLAHGRENRALVLLREAEVEIQEHGRKRTA